MADLTLTTANVLVDTTAASQQLQVTGGEAINCGEVVYQTNAANGWWFKANASNAFLSGSVNGIRIALSEIAGAGQPLMTLRTGRINLGATLDVGETYCVSINTGKIRPFGDMAINEFTTILGFAGNATHLTMPSGGSVAAGVARATNST